MKTLAIALPLAAALLVVVAISLAAPVRAQGGAPPANVRAADGDNPGTVTLSWDAVDNAAFYRIGWVASDRIAAVQAAGRDWQDAFAFADVANLGQTAHTLTDLTPGGRYAFIIGSLDHRYGVALWSEWAYLTLAEAPAISCPTDPGEPTATPAPMPTPAPPGTPAATPMPTPSPMLTLTPTPTPTPQPTPIGTGTGDYDYDADQDGLIEVASLAQLAAIRADLNGDGVAPAPAYAAAFPNAMPGMGCPDAGCTGYELVADLDFDTNGNGEADASDAYWNDGAGWIPIGDEAHKFTADFDGNNHTISNLYINRGKSNYVGLFGYALGNKITRVRLESATVSGRGSVGVMLGCVASSSAISDSYAMGSVSGNNNVGGLVGFSDYNSVISGSYATGSVTGNYNVGGLVGYNFDGAISGSYATSSIFGGNLVGGLVGYGHYARIAASYAVGSVTGDDYVGGLVGSQNYGDITASYATGRVAGDGDDIGSLVGRNEGGAIIASYAIGRVSTSGDTLYIGGLIGYHEGGDIIASYWDTQTTGQAGSYGGVGKTTAELQVPTGSTGIYADWDAEYWDFGNSAQYPVLKYGGLDAAAQRR